MSGKKNVKNELESRVNPTGGMKIGFASDWIFIYLRQEKFPYSRDGDVFINDLEICPRPLRLIN